ncbi:MAG: helix-turn-helix transcriptional regulator [Oscillibacter sp.]|nr:helix-turn-helix transcriptional regulator [Oscillibacter sp.]
MAQFGELLAELRQDRKMTQEDLAKILYVTSGTISNYENGVHLPDIDKLLNLADFFDVTTDYLLGRCSSRLSPDVLDSVIMEGRTAGALINDIRNISPERKQALNIVLKDMQLSTMIGQYNKKEK